MKTVFLVGITLALAASAVSAQQMPQQHVSAAAMRSPRDFGTSNHQTWLNEMDRLTKLRAELAQSWQGMGMSPQAAKLVAGAYDPKKAARIHHPSLRGKSSPEVAQMMQTALKEKRYLDADQLLIDFQLQQAKK